MSHIKGFMTQFHLRWYGVRNMMQLSCISAGVVMSIFLDILITKLFCVQQSMASANYFFKKIQHFLIIYMFFWASSVSGSRKNLKRRIKKITISSLGSIFHFCGIQKEQIYPVRIGRISPCFSALQEVNYKG